MRRGTRHIMVAAALLGDVERMAVDREAELRRL
jgi:hypothetical protein